MVSRKFDDAVHGPSGGRGNPPSIPTPLPLRGLARACLAVVTALVVAGTLALLGEPALAQSAEHSERELGALRQRIEALQRRLAGQTRQRDALVAELQQAETAAGRLTGQLAQTGESLTAAVAEAESAAAAQAAAARRATQARDTLAAQLRQGWQTGRQERLRLLLNQEDPATLGRMLVYQDYLSRARRARLDALLEQLRELRRLAEETDAARARLAALRQRQSDELAALERRRAERAGLLASMDAERQSVTDQLGALRREEAALTALIEQLRRELAGFPADPQTPFSALRGQLTWPVQAPARQGWGDPRGDGSLRWNGVLLSAERGSQVRAVHHGRVIYSDWLPGMGLLVVIDHGGGYLSLYGHNEALLREPGDWVGPGEPVASVGDTGGQRNAGLYFELRKDGQPINPAPWMRAPPGG